MELAAVVAVEPAVEAAVEAALHLQIVLRRQRAQRDVAFPAVGEG